MEPMELMDIKKFKFTDDELCMIDLKCPKCGNELIYRRGNPDFIGCKNFRFCTLGAIQAEIYIAKLRNHIKKITDNKNQT